MPSAHDASGSVSAGFRSSFAASSNLRITISPRPRSSVSRGIVGLALDRACQDLQRVSDAAERHLRPRQRQHRIDVGAVAAVRLSRGRQRRLPLASFLLRQRRREERLLEQRHRLGLLKQQDADHEYRPHTHRISR